MKIRDGVIQKMFELMDESDDRSTAAYNEAYLVFERDLSKEKVDEYEKLLTNMERAAFLAGANCMMDFLTGKE